jgi:DNA replication protein DnaC
MTLASGDGWIGQGANLLLFGSCHAGGVLSARRGGKRHLASAFVLSLVENGRRVLVMRTTRLLQRLQVARRELARSKASPSSTHTVRSSSTSSPMSARPGRNQRAVLI